MSILIEFVDGVNFVEVIYFVRDDSIGDKYVIVQYVDGNFNKLIVFRIGQDLVEIVSYLDNIQVMYVFVRYEFIFDMFNIIKFVYFRW